ncbi:MAG: Holliday junction branch migration protein RuvA [Firmicutes bacterium]|nr:Holliday junction branch migration protein RuvA [Bacillota bacterium]
MIGLLKGYVVSTAKNSLILDVNGVGYSLLVPEFTLKEISRETQVTLYTYLQVRDDALVLYGFSSLDEKALFERIISVSGAGPKTALAILSAMRPVEFLRAVIEGNKPALTKIPGIGKKTADRLLLELKDIGKEFDIAWEAEQSMPVPSGGILQDAVEALISLGYNLGEAEQMVNQAHAMIGDTFDLQKIIKTALSTKSVKSEV